MTDFRTACKTWLLDPEPHTDGDRLLTWVAAGCFVGILILLAVEALLS